MTPEECLEKLLETKSLILMMDKSWLDARALPILDMAIKAVKKQIPRKFNMIDGYIPVCPVCGEEIWDMDWCNSCGQRLDDEEE